MWPTTSRPIRLLPRRRHGRPPSTDIVTTLAGLPPVTPEVTSVNRYDPATTTTGATAVVFRVSFNAQVTGVDAADFVVTVTETVTGSVTAVTAVSPLVYDVTVGNITGKGLIRLDLAAAGTGITGPGGVPIAGGFTSGQTYFRARSPGSTRWPRVVERRRQLGRGVIADGLGAIANFANLDLTTDDTAVLDTPRTLSGLRFGDVAPATPASWIISDGGNAANVLTLDVLSGSPTITVDALGRARSRPSPRRLAARTD